jgi:hypothetical protein
MNTHSNSDESEDSVSLNAAAADRLLCAYGRKVQDLLSQSDAATWVEDLWDMYTGYTAFSQDSGYDRRGHDRFVAFKELVFFFQDIGKMKG